MSLFCGSSDDIYRETFSLLERTFTATRPIRERIFLQQVAIKQDPRNAQLKKHLKNYLLTLTRAEYTELARIVGLCWYLQAPEQMFKGLRQKSSAERCCYMVHLEADQLFLPSSSTVATLVTERTFRGIANGALKEPVIDVILNALQMNCVGISVTLNYPCRGGAHKIASTVINVPRVTHRHLLQFAAERPAVATALGIQPFCHHCHNADCTETPLKPCTECGDVFFCSAECKRLDESHTEKCLLAQIDVATAKLSGVSQFHRGDTVKLETTCGYCRKERLEMKRCARCVARYYCDAECQRADWVQHKHLCVPRKEASVNATLRALNDIPITML
eukprot:TRINITY_DN8812_c0_g1_i1.p2 TRINITY_DN8812_c0_g1~~TRINITY_DN8812_c0_g1_i1.p2  ORF type:complete len:374 (+),score=62.29 TRINITY_DN8812_c0_g1_i1:122-1123(+)